MSTFTVACIFGDHMVLQRQKPVEIWGECNKPQALRVLVSGREVACRQASAGKWKMTLPPMEASRALTLQVSGDVEGEFYVFKDVAVGEVWIAGGQSNMEFPLKYDAEAKKVIAEANNPDIRFYDCPKIKFKGQELEDDMSDYGFWRPCDPDNAPFYSAVGFYFAQKIQESTQVPVGIIGCNWGGTSAATWLDESYLAADEELSVYLHEYEAGLKTLDMDQYMATEKAGRETMKSPLMSKLMNSLLKKTPGPLAYAILTPLLKAAFSKPVTLGPRSENRPGGLYSMVVKKIIGYSARGILWYQGEADDLNRKSEMYARLFTAVIRCWRDAWEDDLPFLFVQLAPFERWTALPAFNYEILREQQDKVSKTVSGAYMASIMDSGARLDIHPKYKRPVGERLALLARGKVYGEDILCEAPEAVEAKLEDGCLTISFTHVGQGLTIKGLTLKSMEIFAEGKEVKPVNVSVAGDTMMVQADGIQTAKGLEIRYAYRNYAEVNLYNSADLPAKPFKMILSQ